MKIITVCGSVRFANEMLKFRDEQHNMGSWVLLPENMELDVQQIDAEVKQKMDILHFRKIELADEILIWNRELYIGESTSREIEYAHLLHKPVYFLESSSQLTPLFSMSLDR